MKYSFITQKKKTYPVGLMCQLMGVSRSAYYDHVRCTDYSEKQCHDEMLEMVRDIVKFSDHSYGSRRKARSLMRDAGVQVKHRKKYKVTINSNHQQPVF